jgi:hypothetical protein
MKTLLTGLCFIIVLNSNATTPYTVLPGVISYRINAVITNGNPSVISEIYIATNE